MALTTPKRSDMRTEDGSALVKRLMEALEELFDQVNENTNPEEFVAVLGESLLLEAMGMKLEAKVNRNMAELSRLRDEMTALRNELDQPSLRGRVRNLTNHTRDVIANASNELPNYF